MARKPSEFVQARKRLAELARASAAYERECEKECDWDDPADRAFHLREKRMEKRLDTLNRLVPTRICPVCQRLAVPSRSWVVNRRADKAVCRRCFFSRGFGRTNVRQTLSVKLFPKETTTYTLDKDSFLTAMRKSGLSHREFARRVGWAQSYQQKLASGEITTISSANAQAMLQVFREADVITKDYVE